MSKESPIYAVPVDPGQIRDENPPEATRIVEVRPPVEGRVITDDMKKTYRYGYSLRIFSGIDIFFNILYCLSDPYWFFPLICSISGYYGAKKFKQNYVLFYFIYQLFNLIGKFIILYYLIYHENYSVFGIVMLFFSIIVNVWILEITVRFLDLMKRLNETQRDILRNLGYKPVLVYY